MVCSGRQTDWPSCDQSNCKCLAISGASSCPFIRHLSCHKNDWPLQPLKDFQLPGSTAISLYCWNPSWWCWKLLAKVSSLVPIRNQQFIQKFGGSESWKSSDFQWRMAKSHNWLLNPVAEVIAQKAPAESVKSIQVQIFGGKKIGVMLGGKQTSLKNLKKSFCILLVRHIRNNYRLKRTNSSRFSASDWQVNAEDYDGPYQLLGTEVHCCNWTQGMPAHVGAWFLDDVDINTSLTMHRVMLLCRCRGGFAMAMHQCTIKFPFHVLPY